MYYGRGHGSIRNGNGRGSVAQAERPVGQRRAPGRRSSTASSNRIRFVGHTRMRLESRRSPCSSVYQIRRPVVHEVPSPLEQVCWPVRGFHPVPDYVRQRRLDHFPGVVGLFGAQSRKLDRKPCGTAPMPFSGPAGAASDHSASRTSFHLAAVSTRNSKASLTAGGASEDRTFASAAPTWRCGSALMCFTTRFCRPSTDRTRSQGLSCGTPSPPPIRAPSARADARIGPWTSLCARSDRGRSGGRARAAPRWRDSLDTYGQVRLPTGESSNVGASLPEMRVDLNGTTTPT